MTKRLVLFDKIYNISSEKEKNEIKKKYQDYLESKVKAFPSTKIEVKKFRSYDNRFEIEINGPEEIFIFNFLTKEIGSIVNFEDLREDNVYKGYIIDAGKVGFGIFVDCALFNPQVDVLIPLRALRTQLCKGLHKSLPEIIKAYDLIENFPVFVKIELIDHEKKNVSGILDTSVLNLYQKFITKNVEGVFISGRSKDQIIMVLKETDHSRDVVLIESLGFLENVLYLQDGTQAAGIISHIGKLLPNSKFSAIKPNRIKMLYS